MNNLRKTNNLMKNFVNDESGQDLIEYALAACLIGLAAVSSMRTLASAISSAFTSIGTTLTGAI